MNSLKIYIPRPCSEDWNNMKVGCISRHCEACQKEVVDFTKMSSQEVVAYLFSNQNNSICGRINSSQLDYHHEELEVMIDSLMAKPTQTNRSIWLLALVSLSLLSCETELSSIHPKKRMDHSELSISNDSIEVEEVFETGFVEVIMGEIALTTPVNVGPDDLLEMAEEMPEFEGGMKALYDFIKQHIIYPKKEQDEISGRVFIQFVVEKDGRITNKKILKSLSEHFDDEVLRLFDQMPNWKPGMQNGQPVRVQMVLPVTFDF